MGPWTQCELGSAALAYPELVEYPMGNNGLVAFLLSLPKQDEEGLMMLTGMYPTEWDLPEQDKEELMMLLGMSSMEWEKRAHEGRERLAKAGQARLRCIVSSAGGSAQTQPNVSSLGRLVVALR